MLKTNSKEARNRIKNFIVENVYPFDYDGHEELKAIITAEADSDTHSVRAWELTKEAINEVFYDEKLKHDNRYKVGRISKQELFSDWCYGLPSFLDCDFVYRLSAVEVLGDLLEETEAERNRYTEEEAERCLIYLMFRELSR